MPNDFPKWRTVYEFYHMWISIGFFDRLIQELNAMARGSQGKSTQPTVAVIDSQSVCTGLTQSVKGVDGGKKIKKFPGSGESFFSRTLSDSYLCFTKGCQALCL